MTQHANGSPGRDVFVVLKGDDGLRVYAARDPSEIHLVTGSGEKLLCSCAASESGERCPHMEAAASHRQPEPTRGIAQPAAHALAANHREEERQMQQSSFPQIMIKRSVSPDGRIDSLSVEVGFPAENLSVGEIRAKADAALKLQADIAESFLGRSNGRNGNGQASTGTTAPDGSVGAEIVGVAGMPGKWGRRLFLNVRAQDRMLRLFGNSRQLAECLETLGYGSYDGRITEGLALNLACRVITKPSEDGKWINIDRILPAPTPSGTGNGR